MEYKFKKLYIRGVKDLITILLITSSSLLVGQNLVPNPSFEILDTCPIISTTINYAQPWFNPSLGSSDIFNSCSTTFPSFFSVPINMWGTQNAYAGGDGYAGLYLVYPWLTVAWNFKEYREYIEVELLDSLQAGTSYHVSFYLSLSDTCLFYSDQVGVYFSQDTTKSDTSSRLYYTPQFSNSAGNYLNDKINWMKVSGSYTASGGERFITIGNFSSNMDTDTFRTMDGASFGCGYYLLDEVCVTTDSNTCGNPVGLFGNSPKDGISIYPNPTTSSITIEGLKKPYKLSLIDALGRLVYQEQEVAGKVKILDLSPYTKGLFMMTIEVDSQVITKKILKE